MPNIWCLFTVSATQNYSTRLCSNRLRRKIRLFTDNMQRVRFFELRTNFHIVNNFDKPNDCEDTLFKVRPTNLYKQP